MKQPNRFALKIEQFNAETQCNYFKISMEDQNIELFTRNADKFSEAENNQHNGLSFYRCNFVQCI